MRIRTGALILVMAATACGSPASSTTQVPATPAATGTETSTSSPVVDPPSAVPAARGHHALAYDAGADVIVLFGGQTHSTTVVDDTWHLDPETMTWELIEPPLRPAGRAAHAMAYDSGSELIVLFGGALRPLSHCISGEGCSDSPGSDTWVYSPATQRWDEVSAPQAPPARSGHRMVYDVQSKRVILFGGWAQASSRRAEALGDTWAFDTTTRQWVEMSPQGGPPPRAMHIMAYDAESDRVLVWGGEPGRDMDGVVWAYDYESNTWTALDGPAAPQPRFNTQAVYLPGLDRVWVAGGTSVVTKETVAGSTTEHQWPTSTLLYDLNSNTWLETEVPGPGLSAFGAAADTRRSRIVIFGSSYSLGFEVDTTFIYDPAAGLWTWFAADGTSGDFAP